MASPESPSQNQATRVLKSLAPVLGIVLLVVGGLSLIKLKYPSAPHGDVLQAGSPSEKFSLEIGSQLPDFTLQKFEQGEVLASKLPAKVTLINFWATWCGPCMSEMPSIVKLRKAYLDKGFDVAAVDMDDDPTSVLPPTLKRLGIDFPVFWDKDQKLADFFDIHAIPLTLIVDQHLKVLLIDSGGRDWNGLEIRGMLEGWLKG